MNDGGSILAIELSDFELELEDGGIDNVGPSNRTGSAKLFDVDGVTARPFGDKRVKLGVEDEAGSEVRVALVPEVVDRLADDLECIRKEMEVFE